MNAHISVKETEYYVVLSDPEDHIQRHLLTGQPYEYGMLRHMVARVGSGPVVDVGANIGNHSLYLAAMGVAVVGFEPDPVLASCAALSARLNDFPHMEVLNEALGSERTTARLVAPEPGNAGMTSLKVGRGNIPVTPLDDFKMAPVCIKIDVEGMELKVLHGARETIAKHRPLLYVEAHAGEYAELAQWMADHGYERRSRFNATPTYYYAPRERAER